MTPARLRLPASPIAPALARAGLRHLCDGLPEVLCSDLNLLTSEVVVNAVQHSGATAEVGEIDVTAMATTEVIRVAVTDPGPGFEPEPTPPGFGLRIVDRLSSRWGVERSGNRTTVWFELDVVG